MMDFFSRCWKSIRPRGRWIWLWLLAPALVYAQAIAVKNAELFQNEDWYHLQADFDVGFSKPVEEALERGIGLNFVVELEVTRPRWYWFDESIASVRQNVRISYHALTRQYFYAGERGNLRFNTLSEAKDALRHIPEWKVFDRGLLQRGINYRVAVRMKLDVKQLPKPLQVEALGSKDWELGSDWFRFSITP